MPNRALSSIPDFQTIMLPLLEFAADAREHSKAEAVQHLAAIGYPVFEGTKNDR